MLVNIRQCLLAALLLGLACTAHAEDASDPFDDWSDWDEDAEIYTGYLEYRLATRFSPNPLFRHRASRDELKLKFDASDQIASARWDFELDLYADSLEGRARADLREATLSFDTPGSGQIKLGRQVLGWGTGDLLFINDRFPKDFSLPLSGGEDFYFKAPSNTLRYLGAVGPLSIDLAYTPEFTPDRFPDGRRLSVFNPVQGQLIGGGRRVDPPRPHGAETALRLASTVGGIEYAGYAYRGFDKQPLSASSIAEPRFRRRDSLGASLRGPLLGGIGALEVGREWRGNAPDNDVAVVPNKTALMAGFERELRAKLTAGMQLYYERFADHPRALHPLAQGERQLLSLRLTQLSMQDRLQLSAIQFYSPNQHDRWLRATASFRFSDTWLSGAQVTLFAGNQNTLFGQFEDDSQWALWLRRQF